MITLRLLTPLLLAIALASGPLLAQPEATNTTAKPVQEPNKKAPAPADPAAPEQAKKSTVPEKGKDSPFDYSASEQISEDLPVSFPVDI